MPAMRDTMTLVLLFIGISVVFLLLPALAFGGFPVLGLLLALLGYFLAYSWWTSQGQVHLLVDGAARCGSRVILQGTPISSGVTCAACRRAMRADRG